MTLYLYTLFGFLTRERVVKEEIIPKNDCFCEFYLCWIIHTCVLLPDKANLNKIIICISPWSNVRKLVLLIITIVMSDAYCMPPHL